MIFTFIETKYNIAIYFLQKNSYLFDLLSTNEWQRTEDSFVFNNKYICCS